MKMSVKPKAVSKPKKNHSQQDNLSHLAKAIISNAGVGIYIVQDGKFVYVSELYQRLSGYTDTELIGTDFLNNIYPDDKEMVRGEAIKCLKGESFEPYEYRFVKKNHEVMWVLETITPIVYKDDRAILGSFLDITERKKVEEKLRQEEQRFRAIAEQSSDIIIFVNQEGIITYGNPAVKRSLGLRTDGRIGISIFERIHPDDLKFASDAFNTFTLNTSSKDINSPVRQIRLRHQDGSWRTFETVGSKLLHNNIVESVIINLRDITERKLAEEALRESEKKYRLLADNIHDVVFVMDMNLHYTYISPSVKILRGYEPEEAMKHTPAETLAPSSVDLAMRALSEIIGMEKSGHRDMNISKTLQLEMSRKDGTTVWVETTASFIRDENQRPVGIMGVTRDITERKQIEEMLRKSELNYRQLFDNAPAAIYQIDFRTGKFLKANDLICEYFGCSQEEVTSISPYDLLTQESQILFLERLNKMAIGDKVPEDPEYEFVDKNGKRRWLKLNCRNIYDSKGLAGADVVAHEITGRKRMEDVLQESERRYRELSIIDDLTHLYNARHFYAQMEREIERSNRYEQPLTLLLLDLDKFKDFNDTYGHVEGDNVLSRLGQVIKGCLRETDSAYRYGGEEFTIILPMTTGEEGIITAKRIQTELRQETFSPTLDQEIYITVSIGLSHYKPKEEMKTFVHRVDQLMYQAKKNGRDRICSES